MTIELRLYAHLRDPVGAKTIEREVPRNATVEAVLRSLAAEFPELEDTFFDDDGTVSETLLVRRDHETVAPDAAVADGDTLAITTQIVGGDR